MKLYYACKDINNFGDIVPAYVFKRFNVEMEWANHDEAELFAGGSVMSEVNENAIVQCLGFSSPRLKCVKPKQIKSVRGKLTRNRLLELGIDCPEVYNDMVDFLPPIFYPRIEKEFKLGYIPHYVDYKYFKNKYGDCVIDITSGVENVITHLMKCEKVKCSSLHGIIAAQTYGIQWEWFRHNKISSPDFKFQDYFSRLGIENLTPEVL
jgi:pyruvyltransferase